MPPHIPQPEAKRYIPPGAHIWVGYTREAWCGHLKPFKRVSAAFGSSGGSQGALREVLRMLWSDYLFSRGEEQAMCPWAGIF